jgi:hypothetical protein
MGPGGETFPTFFVVLIANRSGSCETQSFRLAATAKCSQVFSTTRVALAARLMGRKPCPSALKTSSRIRRQPKVVWDDRADLFTPEAGQAIRAKVEAAHRASCSPSLNLTDAEQLQITELLGEKDAPDRPLQQVRTTTRTSTR